MSEVGGYSLHLYCDDPKHGERADRFMEEHLRHYVSNHEYDGQTLAETRRAARRAGWKTGKTVQCPRCRKAP